MSRNTSRTAYASPRYPRPYMRWLKYALILASNTVYILFLVRSGIAAFEILVLAAAEILIILWFSPFVLAIHRLATEGDQGPGFERPSVLREFIGAIPALVFLTAVMALFPGLAWLMAEVRPETPLFFDHPAFREAAFYISLVLLARFMLELIEAAQGAFDEWNPSNLGPVLHYCVTLFTVAAGSVGILVLDWPVITLVVFFVVKTAVDLVVVRYLEHNPAVTRLLDTVRVKRKRLDSN